MATGLIGLPAAPVTGSASGFNQVDALAVGHGPFHKLLDFPQLPLRLEKRTLLSHHHGWAS